MRKEWLEKFAAEIPADSRTDLSCFWNQVRLTGFPAWSKNKGSRGGFGLGNPEVEVLADGLVRLDRWREVENINKLPFLIWFVWSKKEMVLLTLFRAGQLSCRRTLCGPYICEIGGVALVSNPRLICAAIGKAEQVISGWIRLNSMENLANSNFDVHIQWLRLFASASVTEKWPSLSQPILRIFRINSGLRFQPDERWRWVALETPICCLLPIPHEHAPLELSVK